MTGEYEFHVHPAWQCLLIIYFSVVGCGSDIKFWRTGCVGSIVIKEPLGLGHESFGEVVEIGKNVRKLKVGDGVAIQ